MLAVVGFGTKAGFMPVHVWLPEAHPAAPSHVSAVMSGVMIKTGIYGLIRVLTFLGEPPAWWGWTLVGIGVSSGLLGVLFALAQHDLKRLLAYSSVENVGIITLGLGVGLLGVHYRLPAMAVLGYLGALLHVLNHALFKSLLFLGAGAIQHATGTRNLNQLGGLLKRMPVTGAAFFLGVCAICGLPPLNGFVSELLIYLAALSGLTDTARASGVQWALLCVLVLGGLALIGGLAVVTFTKAFGFVFLGAPRSEAAESGHEVGIRMRGAMAFLAGGCVLAALAAPFWPLVLGSTVTALTPLSWQGLTGAAADRAALPLTVVCASCVAVWALVGLLALFRRWLLAGRAVTAGPTWDCGYAAPHARMQYSGSSYIDPVLAVFRTMLRPQIRLQPPAGLFPAEARFQSDVPDVFRDRLFRPVFWSVMWAASKLRWLQQGRIQLYVLYIAVTVLSLLIWKLG
jgi:formate hydrogenlyase subunit 3/multisubunit Na+/H+ antiporter MnhD subunit